MERGSRTSEAMLPFSLYGFRRIRHALPSEMPTITSTLRYVTVPADGCTWRVPGDDRFDQSIGRQAGECGSAISQRLKKIRDRRRRCALSRAEIVLPTVLDHASQCGVAVGIEGSERQAGEQLEEL
jgi:hypothetical protein